MKVEKLKLFHRRTENEMKLQRLIPPGTLFTVCKPLSPPDCSMKMLSS